MQCTVYCTYSVICCSHFVVLSVHSAQCTVVLFLCQGQLWVTLSKKWRVQRALMFEKMYTVHCKLHTAHCALYNSHCTPQNNPYTLNSSNWIVQPASFTLQTAACTPHTKQRTLKNTHCTEHITNGTLLFCTLHIAPKALHTAQITVLLRTVKCTLGIQHTALHTANFTRHAADCRLNSAHCTKIVLAGSLNSSLQQGAASWPYSPHQTLRGLEGPLGGAMQVLFRISFAVRPISTLFTLILSLY